MPRKALQSGEVHVEESVVVRVVDVLLVMRGAFADDSAVLRSDKTRERKRFPTGAGKRIRREDERTVVDADMQRAAEVRMRVEYFPVVDEEVQLARASFQCDSWLVRDSA